MIGPSIFLPVVPSLNILETVICFFCNFAWSYATRRVQKWQSRIFKIQEKGFPFWGDMWGILLFSEKMLIKTSQPGTFSRSWSWGTLVTRPQFLGVRVMYDCFEFLKICTGNRPWDFIWDSITKSKSFQYPTY